MHPAGHMLPTGRVFEIPDLMHNYFFALLDQTMVAALFLSSIFALLLVRTATENTVKKLI
jgi:hypothetical protein